MGKEGTGEEREGRDRSFRMEKWMSPPMPEEGRHAGVV